MLLVITQQVIQPQKHSKDIKMIVRLADKHDIPHIQRLLVLFQAESPHKKYGAPDADYLNRILTRCLLGGVIVVAQDNKQIVGTLISIIQSDLWFPNLQRLIELAWYVEKDYRNTTAGSRLINEYIKQANMLKDDSRIENYSISLMKNSPDINLTKRGFSLEERTFVSGV